MELTVVHISAVLFRKLGRWTEATSHGILDAWVSPKFGRMIKRIKREMKKLILAALALSVILPASVAHGQELKKGTLVGVHTYNT
jgi:hypothetical protein